LRTLIRNRWRDANHKTQKFSAKICIKVLTTDFHRLIAALVSAICSRLFPTKSQRIFCENLRDLREKFMCRKRHKSFLRQSAKSAGELETTKQKKTKVFCAMLHILREN
jgi:hypothetical protein